MFRNGEPHAPPIIHMKNRGWRWREGVARMAQRSGIFRIAQSGLFIVKRFDLRLAVAANASIPHRDIRPVHGDFPEFLRLRLTKLARWIIHYVDVNKILYSESRPDSKGSVD